MKPLLTLLLLQLSSVLLAQNVGIGTTTPSRKLTVRTDNIGITQESADGTVQIGFYTSNTTGAFLQTHTNHSLNFSTFNGNAQATLLANGNFGIGTTAPGAKLEINGQVKITGGTPGDGKLLQSDANGLASWVDKAAFALPTGATGNTIRHNGTGWITASNLFNTGTNIGIGTVSPTYLLDVNGRIRIRNNGLTSGVWFNKADNTEAAFVGMINDTTAGFWGNGTVGSWKMAVDVKNSKVGIGVTEPVASLSFDNNAGNKISLWGTNKDANYGVGIQSSLLQLYSNTAAADIAFGYGSSAAFTENMRIRGNGNVGIGTITPGYKLTVKGDAFAEILNVVSNVSGFGALVNLNNTGNGINTVMSGGSFGLMVTGATSTGIDVSAIGNPLQSIVVNKGRIRFKGNIADGSAHGLTFTNNAGTADRGFMGQFDDNTLGFYGFGGAGWGMLWNVNNGQLRIGTTNQPTGYKVAIGGKVIAEEVRVQLQGVWPDYVFADDYRKMSISDLEKFVDSNRHLPNIPSAGEIAANGHHLGELQQKMLEKIEELSLYIIELNKKIDAQQAEIDQLKKPASF